MKCLLSAIAIFTAALSFSLPTNAAMGKSGTESEANCLIKEGGYVKYKGKCLFFPEGGGSFSVAHPNGWHVPLYRGSSGDVHVVGLQLEKQGNRISRAYEGDAISFESNARRSSTNKGCWVAGNVELCAWK